MLFCVFHVRTHGGIRRIRITLFDGGKNGAMLKKVGAMARTDIEELLGCRVYLQLWVKVKEGWRDSVGLIRNFGYDERM